LWLFRLLPAAILKGVEKLQGRTFRLGVYTKGSGSGFLIDDGCRQPLGRLLAMAEGDMGN
jgi:hypothetical protein